jgi:dienelactone hydrolase/lysophospholipase L1-like esterase
VTAAGAPDAADAPGGPTGRGETAPALHPAASPPRPGVAAPPVDRPRVLLLGDSIRLGYAPLVSVRLAESAAVTSPAPNGGDSANLLRHLEAWLAGASPDVVHVNCGLHDLKRDRVTGAYQVPLAQYVANLRALVDRLRSATDAALVFAATTPIDDARHAGRGAGFDRFDADVRRYNAGAAEVMRAAAVPVHDLYWVVESGGRAALLAQDGTHYTPGGYERLAAAVADCVQRQLIVRHYRPLPGPAAGPEAGAAYRAREAERDALVPAAYAGAPVGTFRVPEDAGAWAARRPGVQATVVRALGELPPRPAPPRVRRVTREVRPGYTLEKVALENGVDGEVSALLLIPEGLAQPAPAVLWLHSSTPDKTQIVIPDTNGGREPLGEALARAGYVVMAPDAYWHGDRAGTGPAGGAETRREEQESLFKFHLWHGRTLWGMFVRDDQVALDYLCTRPEVDAARIGATGMSMGSTRAWWLAALDERVAAAVGIACLTRYQNLIAHGQLRAHGIYYFVNGLLRHFDTEGVVALIAPRPFLALTGDLDAGSPADGIRTLTERVGRVYAALGAEERFESILYPDVGHTVTPEMRRATLAWFERWLRPAGTATDTPARR